MRNGSILAQCRARVWDGLGPRLEQQHPGTVPSQPAANTPRGRGSGAQEDVAGFCSDGGDGRNIYTKAGSPHDYKSLKLYCDIHVLTLLQLSF